MCVYALMAPTRFVVYTFGGMPHSVLYEATGQVKEGHAQ